ncbi:MAG TPA: glycosyl hydrolase family 28 protein [Bacteroidales bacterium]|nr:glycosyl hydrolase family 28 protein [Bacteroidales bacterium]
MKSKSLLKLIIFLICTAEIVLNSSCVTIVTYPTPPGLKTSPDLKLTVSNKPVWVERIETKLDTFNYTTGIYGGMKMEAMDAAGFSFEGKVRINITVSDDIVRYVIRPKSRNISASVNGNELSFEIDSPQKLYIEINDLPHLAIFADAPEKEPQSEGSRDILYFGPGEHKPGKIELQSNQTLYIAAGAIVYADITGRDLANVTIRGRGMLNGNVRISGTRNLNVSDVFIRNTKGWTNTLTDCQYCRYSNIKVFSYEGIWGLDGINPVSSKNFSIDNCFMRCRDDCVAIKSMDPKLSVDSVSVTNCVMVGWSCSDGVTLGFELNGGPVQNISVKNCDILYARGGGRTGGHAGFSIVCDGPATVQNILFEDIRIEEQVEFRNLELIITDGTLYGIDPPGHIKNVIMRNISWENGDKPFIISGFSSENKVENVIFQNCTSGGKPLRSSADADFRINEFTDNIIFQAD